MPTKTISIMEEAYDALKTEQSEGESFTETILRITARRGKLADSAGKWKISDSEWNRIQRELKQEWKRWGKRYEVP